MATQIAQAYVQIMPSAKGIKGSITKAMGGESKSAGHSAGMSFAGKFKKIIAAAGIGVALKKAITEGAALEQSIGGIETLFKDSADVIKQRADEAYRTAGMSANQYMELTTSFSASLLQSLGGDTAKAADISDMAMTDMSDNANKMGTDMERITDAYQGFAKQNYTMLDNLKLGYGGTKTEMQRLLADAQKITGIEYNIDNLSDVYSAIHVIQGELDITGTTAKEAASTISGSAAAMKAAFKNVLGKLTLGEDIDHALNRLMETVVTFGANLLPALKNILKAIPGAIVTIFKTALPQLKTALSDMIPKIIEALQTKIPQLIVSAGEAIKGWIAGFRERLPEVLTTGTEVINNIVTGIQTALAQLATTGFEVINEFLSAIMANLPQILQSGVSMIGNLIQGLLSNLPGLLQAAGQAVITLISGIIQNLPQIISAGFDLIVSLIQGIGNAAPNILSTIGSLMQQLWETIKDIDWVSLGKNIIEGLINGIGSMVGALVEAAKNVGEKCLEAIKEKLGIGSPSKAFRDQVGKWIPAGIAVGIEENTRPVASAMRRLAGTALYTVPGDVNMGMQPAFAGSTSGVVFNQTIYTHDSLSESELTREAEDLFARQGWGLP